MCVAAVLRVRFGSDKVLVTSIVMVCYRFGDVGCAGRSGEHPVATGGNLRVAWLALFAAYCGKRGARQRLRCIFPVMSRFLT